MYYDDKLIAIDLYNHFMILFRNQIKLYSIYIMNFKLTGKNKVGGAALLLLVVLLSQSNFLDFLVDTALRRAVLILFIIVISYVNKILGVVSVLMIIVMFNSGGFLEGLELMDKTTLDIPPPPEIDSPAPADAPTVDAATMDTTTMDTTTMDAATMNATTMDATTMDAATMDAPTMDFPVTDYPASTSTDMNSSQSTQETLDALKRELKNILDTKTNPSFDETENVSTGVEGFDVLGTERALQKGKTSNCMGNKNDRSCDSAIPVEGGSMFSSVYSLF